MGATATEQVLVAYCHLREKKTGKRLKVTSAKMRSAAERFAKWCDEKKVDPTAFMRSRFDAAPEGKHPGLASLRSEVALEKWHTYREGMQLEGDHYDRLVRDLDTPLRSKVRRLLFPALPAMELLRADYVARDRAWVCLNESQIGGYDPRSRTCPSCPIRHHCLAHVSQEAGFDVGALRTGELQRLPADVAQTARELLFQGLTQ